MHRYAMKTLGSGELLSQNGAVIVHDNKMELEWLVRGPFEVIELPKQGIGRPLISLESACNGAVSFPLDKRDFRDPR